MGFDIVPMVMLIVALSFALGYIVSDWLFSVEENDIVEATILYLAKNGYVAYEYDENNNINLLEIEIVEKPTIDENAEQIISSDESKSRTEDES